MRDRDDEYDLDESDELDGDDLAPLPCGNCLGTITEESQRCPHCGHYLTDEQPLRRAPVWILVGIAMCLAVILHWMINHR